ncbi:gallidermin/nisin family lantibiotic [Lactiplantibacillus plantarum]|uniref:gallidermin/nisin family lantibiotic n=1 Tax=Lactobacillaceae TaxID=33958 RepID=UPI0026F8513A|nr:gallidermin/nisin family lantibiotic [Pediococcus acidilactici]MDO7803154.1 gallidermin/nisin family lantibiotic [Pediococcus acidilactici]
MSNFKDFDLGMTSVKNTNTSGDVDPRWKSKSLCTPGCKTGVLMGCALKSISCHIHISK